MSCLQIWRLENIADVSYFCPLFWNLEKIMWFKLILLLIYVAVLFVLARVLEAVSWIETGVLSHRLLDPMTLSVLKLKTLLEQRGVSYEGVVEKPELSELVDTTGKNINSQRREGEGVLQCSMWQIVIP